MPEIIQFSNDLCYANNGTPLDPLRAYPANRLKPLVVRHVPDGYRAGNSQNALNEPEADAVLAQIVAFLADSRYAGRTIGVISLQGEAWAKLIEHKLLESLEQEAELFKIYRPSTKAVIDTSDSTIGETAKNIARTILLEDYSPFDFFVRLNEVIKGRGKL
jgi:hypothetical protein